MMTAKQTDEREKYLLSELNNLEIRLIYAKDFTPHKVEYWKERIEIIRYELKMITEPSFNAIERLNKLKALLK